MKQMMYFHSRVWLMCLVAAIASQAGDWPQYRGPQHDGSTSERIARWTGDGPRQLWKVPTTDGFSSFSIKGGKAFTLVKRDVEGVAQEVCVAVDADQGKELWATPLGIAKYEGGGDDGTSDNRGGDGPRSTPTLDGDKVYVLSANLIVSCLQADTGNVLWSRDLVKDHGAKNITWKNAASPVLDGNVIYVAGGADGQCFLALNKNDGSVVWKTGSDKITHATPVPATIHGVRQVIFFMQSGLVSLGAADGKELWKHPFKFSVSTAASPVVAGDIVYCAAGYGVGASAARISKSGDAWTATELWRTTGNKPVCNHWSTPVYKDGYLYGMFSFKEYGKGPLKCVEVATGKVMWQKENFGAGQVILAADTLVALGDAGQLVLVDPNPKEYRELARATVVSGKCWSTPSLSNGRLYVRSTKEGVCLDVSGKLASK
jgi:outer membrane protein assembly factor BamB